MLTLLSACGPQSGNQRPDDATLRKGIAQLTQTFEGKYPKLKTWDDAAVKAQIATKLPTGNATEAGWHLVWPNASATELSQVYGTATVGCGVVPADVQAEFGFGCPSN